MDFKDLLKEYFPKTLLGTILLIIIFLILNIMCKINSAISIFVALIIVHILNEIRLYFKYRCKKKKREKTILILLKTEDHTLFKDIKEKLENEVESIVKKYQLSDLINVRFIDNYIYNKRMYEIHNKIIFKIYNYTYYQVLFVNETTKNGKECISIIPNLEIINNNRKKNKNVNDINFLKSFSDKIIEEVELLNKDNMFEDIKDLSSSILISCCFIVATILPDIADYDLNSLEKAKQIYKHALDHCRSQKQISKKYRRIYIKYENLFSTLKNLTILFQIKEYLNYEEIEKKLKKKHAKNVKDVLEIEKINELFGEFSNINKNIPAYYTNSVIFNFFMGTSYIKLIDILNEEENCLKIFKKNCKEEDVLVYYLNRAFIELYFGKFNDGFDYYKKAYKFFVNTNISRENIKNIVKDIKLFCKIIYNLNENIACEFTSYFVEWFDENIEAQNNKYRKLLKNKRYSELPIEIQENFEKLRETKKFLENIR